MAPLGAPRSAPGYFNAIFANLIIARQVLAFVDTQPVMDEFHIRDENSVRFLAITMTLVHMYELIGALEDSWTVYWTSLVSRAVAVSLLYWIGSGWESVGHMELGSAVGLASCMWWSRSRSIH